MNDQENLQKTMIEVLKSRDSKRGTELANNLLQSMGLSKEDAVSQATAWAKQASQDDPRIKQLIQVLIPGFKF